MPNSETYIKQLPFMVFDSGSKTLVAVEIVSKRSICYGYLVDFVLTKYIYKIKFHFSAILRHNFLYFGKIIFLFFSIPHSKYLTDNDTQYKIHVHVSHQIKQLCGLFFRQTNFWHNICCLLLFSWLFIVNRIHRIVIYEKHEFS